MRSGSKELAREIGIPLEADSIPLASPVGFAHLKGNLKEYKNQVNFGRGCSISLENVVY